VVIEHNKAATYTWALQAEDCLGVTQIEGYASTAIICSTYGYPARIPDILLTIAKTMGTYEKFEITSM
jgi:hypothetical protein